MAFEGNSVEFSITNTTDTRKTFYWTLEAVEGNQDRATSMNPLLDYLQEFSPAITMQMLHSILAKAD